MINVILSLFLLIVPKYPTGRVVKFSWEAPLTNQDGGELTPLRGYRLYIRPRGKAWRLVARVSPTRTSVPYLARDRGEYYAKVTAVNIEGHESAPSNEIRFIFR